MEDDEHISFRAITIGFMTVLQQSHFPKIKEKDGVSKLESSSPCEALDASKVWSAYEESYLGADFHNQPDSRSHALPMPQLMGLLLGGSHGLVLTPSFEGNRGNFLRPG